MISRSVRLRARSLTVSASSAVLASMLLMPGQAFAQQADDSASATTSVSAQTSPDAGNNPETSPANAATDDPTTVVVTGQRRALQTSRNIKRNADTVVDSITATDIGAFPDKSVAEALQRVPGITVNRFAASSDTAHFSAEPSGVIVRGLPQVRSEFNGRDTFSANSNRGLSWQDITPELMAGVDTYKNQTAEMIEGGIAGSINLRTRVPFDATGQLIQIGAKANYGDISKKWTPDINGFYSNRWATGFGEVGVMGNVAYSDVRTASQGIQYGRVGIFDDGVFPDSTGTVYVPSSLTFRDNEYDRKRLGIAAAAQWRSLDRKLLATVQFNRSTNKTKWEERAFGANGLFDLYGSDVRFRYYDGGPSLNEVPIAPPGAPAFTFNSDGTFQTGTFNKGRDVAWWGTPVAFGGNPAIGYGVNDQGEAMFDQCYTWGGNATCNGSTYGTGVGTASRYNNNKNMTQDIGANLKWEATDRLRFNFDGQYVKSKIDNYDIEVDFNSFADVTIDATGTYPRIGLAPPNNINQSAGGLANPNNWYINSVMDHLEKSTGKEVALRADGEYDLKTNWLDSIKFGARYSDRDQTVRWSTYNWQNIANTWTDYAPCAHPFWNLDSQPATCGSTTFNGYPSGFYEVAPFGADFHGGTLGEFPFVPFDFLRDRSQIAKFSREVTGVGNFIPICERNGQIPGTTPIEEPDSCFTADEIADVSESTKAVYAMLRFGGPDATIGGIPVSGNIGLRWVGTKDVSNGSFRFPTISGIDATKCPATPLVPGGLTGTGTPTPPPVGAPPAALFPAYCYLSPQDIAYSSGGANPTSASAKHSNFLPSFNVKFDVSPTWVARFAASKAMSRPDIGLLKNFTSLTVGLPSGSDLSDSRWVIGPSGQPIGLNPYYSANAYNPYLKPITAWQFDLSLEHYFGNAGLFSFALFNKRFKDYIQYGSFLLDVERDGVTRTVEVRGPANGSGAKISGFEVAYNRFFDFLPKPLDGLGIQANYTFVKNSGVPNGNLTPVGGTGGAVTNAGNAGTALNPGALEGLSKHTFNLVGMYEKGPISARLAYNWRSRYLVTAVDCCVYLPVWQKSAGYLDGSIRYKATDFLELSFEASNILNTKTRLQQQVTDEESPEGKRLLLPNGWFQNDRRFILGARIRFGK